MESCLRHGFGAEIGLPTDTDPFVMLFSESSGRVLVSVLPGAEDDLIALCNEHGIHRHRLGQVRGSEDPDLQIAGQLVVPLADLRAAWSETLPAAMAAL